MMSDPPRAKPVGPVAGATSRPKRSRAELVRLVLAALLGGLTVAFALLNLAKVEVDWIFGTWQTPLIVVIVLSLIVGALLGFTLAHRRYVGQGKKRARHSGGARDR